MIPPVAHPFTEPAVQMLVPKSYLVMEKSHECNQHPRHRCNHKLAKLDLSRCQRTIQMW